MKIIKRGTLPSERVYRTTCGRCHTQYECAGAEGKIESDRHGTFFCSKCPVCGGNNMVVAP